MHCGVWSTIAALCLSAATGAVARQEQQPGRARPNWPCGGHLDPSYFQLAEATGGELWMVAPWEIAASAPLMQASSDHPQTIFRLGGSINPGTHEFRVPIDSSVESVVFSVSVQCLQTAEVLRPTGEPASGAGVTDYADFTAERMVVVERPAAGLWTIRAAGSGVAGVMVRARSLLHLASVEFAPPGVDRFGPLPSRGVENTVRLSVRGRPAHIDAVIVDAAAKDMVPLALTPVGGDGSYLARFTPGAGSFRVMIRGTDASGAVFQRVYPSLFTAQ